MRLVGIDQLDTIVDAFSQGKVIVFPTETSYGVGCDATNAQAVERVIAVKQRRPDKGLPVLIHSADEAKKHIVFNKIAEDITHRHWPGPLNLISTIQQGSTIVDACHKNGMQAVRYSSSPFVRALLARFDRPIVATSANISGAESCYSAQAAMAQFEGAEYQPDLVVDGGMLPQVPASTMVRVVGDRVDVVRFGGIAV